MDKNLGTPPDCKYIGGHKPGFDQECYWCVNEKRNAYGIALFKPPTTS